MSFPFENLTVYQKSLRLVQEIENLTTERRKEISRVQFDQLNRAALSIPLNIAEGNGRWHLKEKRNFFWISRGSAFEVVAILQILKNKGVLQEEKYWAFYREIESLSKMLTSLIQTLEKREKQALI